MAKRNLLNQMLNPVASVGKNMFDLSQGHKFSSLAGQCVPVLCEDLQPGDVFDISSAVKCRTQPFNTAAWFNCKVNFDFFFVPYWQVWSLWPQFYYQQLNAKSALQMQVTSDPVQFPLYQPNVLLSDLINNIYSVKSTTGLGMCKLLDMLGYGDYYDVLKDAPEGEDADYYKQLALLRVGTRSVSPFRLYAYRKIWHDYYINKWRDPDAYGTIQTFNLDNIACTSYNNSLVSDSQIINTMQMRQAPYRKDIFTSSLPSRQYGAVSAFNVSGLVSASRLSSSANLNDLRSYGSVEGGYQKVGLSPSSQNTMSPEVQASLRLDNAVDVYAIKQAEALQAWKEAHMRAGNRVAQQQKAMFGIDSPEMDSDLVQHIGGFDMQVLIDDIRSTEVGTPSESRPNGYLGELGGTGIGYATKDGIRYECKEHGILMCIAAAVPQFDYCPAMVDKNVRRSVATDYFNPKFDNLGLEPIVLADYGGNHLSPTSDTYPLGYAPANWEYKSRIDKAHMNFRRGGTLQHFTTVREELLMPGLNPTFPTSFFYIQPSLLDSVFMINANPADMDTDQFLFDCYFDIKALRPMSKLGLPNFN